MAFGRAQARSSCGDQTHRALARSGKCHPLANPARTGFAAATSWAHRLHKRRPKQNADALAILTSQHEDVDRLLAKIERATTRDAKVVLFGEMADKLAAHLTIEEQLFYPAILAKSTEDELREATEEHLAIKRVLADMLALDPMDDSFAAKLKVLTEEISHHAHEEEEDELFPKVRKLMAQEELLALGGELLAMFDGLLARHPSKHVPKETDAAADLGAA